MNYTTTSTNVTCRCCGGSGKQQRNDGIWIICPACGGTGNETTFIPYVQPYPYTYPTWPQWPYQITWSST